MLAPRSLQTEFTLSEIEVNILNQIVEEIRKWFVENTLVSNFQLEII